MNQTIKTYISGFKWAGTKPFLYDLAARYNLQLDITETDRGWVTETIYYSITGTPENLLKFNASLKKVVQEYNSK